MKCIVDNKALGMAVKSLKGAKGRIRTAIRVEATGHNGTSRLTLERGNGQTWIRRTIDAADCFAPGVVWLEPDGFGKAVAVRDLDATVTLEQDSPTPDGDPGALEVKGDNGKARLFASKDDAGWPWPESEGVKPLTGTLPAGDLADAIAATLPAVARENSRYAINGVYIVADGKGGGEVVATDGRRMVVFRLKNLTGDKFGVIVHTDTLKALAAELKSDPCADVRVTVDDVAGVTFAGGAFAVHGHIVDGSFPPYQDVILRDPDKMAVVKRDEFLAELKRAAVFTNEESRGVRMTFKPGSGKGTTPDHSGEFNTRLPETGEYTERMLSLREYRGAAIDIGFNPSFMADAIRTGAATDSEYLSIALKAPNKACMVGAGLKADLSDARCLTVLMPVNLA